MTFPTLETDRLILRRLELGDAPVIQQLAGAREVAEMTLLIPHPYPDGAAETFIRGTWDSAAKEQDFTFAIVRKKDSAFIGVIGIHLKEIHNRAEIGYWLGVPYWGNGYATEAARAVIAFGFETLNLNRIYAGYFTKNPASRRVQEKAGMTFEGILRQDVIRWGAYQDHGICAILREDYFRAKSAP